MLKKLSHIILTLVLLITVTGISTAKMVCNFSVEEEVSCTVDNECTHEDCCEITKEHKKLDVDLTDEKESVDAPEVLAMPVPLFDSVPDLKVAMRYNGHSDLLYKTPLQSRDIPVLNQNFRL